MKFNLNRLLNNKIINLNKLFFVFKHSKKNNNFYSYNSKPIYNYESHLIKFFSFHCNLQINNYYLNNFIYSYFKTVKQSYLINNKILYLKFLNLFYVNSLFFFKNHLNVIKILANDKTFNNFNFFRNTTPFILSYKNNKILFYKNKLFYVFKKLIYFKKIKFSLIYFLFVKLFFKTMLSLKKQILNNSSFFLISNFDSINNTFLRLTNSTKTINFFDFYFSSKNNLFKNINKFKISLNKWIALITPSDLIFHNKQKSLYDVNKNHKNLFNYNLTNFYKFYYFWNKIEFLNYFIFKPIFFKTIQYITTINFHIKNHFNCNYIYQKLTNYFNLFYFYNSPLNQKLTNLIPHDVFQYLFKKTVIRVFDFDKFSNISTPWHYQTLLKFLEFCSGKKACIRLNGFLNNTLTVEEKIRCLLWSQRVKYFRKVLGPRLFLNESIQIMYLALKNKDPYLLSNWMVTTMYKLSFWKYKTFLRYLKYVFRYLFWSIFRELNIKGIKFQLKGKISVAGNARTRTAFHYIGFTSHATFNNKILYNLSLVKSFTGVMGLKLWIVF